MKWSAGWFAVLAGIGTSACELTYEPDVGPVKAELASVDGGTGDGDGGGGGGRCGDSDPETSISFANEILPLFTRDDGGCGGCHTENSKAGFNLSSYENLRRGGQNSGARIVVPGDPCASILVQKLGVAPPFGSRMPYNAPPNLTSAELTLISDWIAEGALLN